MKTINELEKMDYISKQKYIDNLTDKVRTNLLRRITTELSKRKKNYKLLLEYKEEFYKTHNVDWYQLENLKSQVSHNYKIKDFIVLKDTYKIVEISKTIGVKQYQIKRSAGFAYTLDKIHEDDILCHVRQFDVNKIIKGKNKE